MIEEISRRRYTQEEDANNIRRTKMTIKILECLLVYLSFDFIYNRAIIYTIVYDTLLSVIKNRQRRQEGYLCESSICNNAGQHQYGLKYQYQSVVKATEHGWVQATPEKSPPSFTIYLLASCDPCTTALVRAQGVLVSVNRRRGFIPNIIAIAFVWQHHYCTDVVIAHYHHPITCLLYMAHHNNNNNIIMLFDNNIGIVYSNNHHHKI